MKINGKDYLTCWFEDNQVKLINQLVLPHVFQIKSYKTYKEVISAIKTMVVRGAPAIGVAGAYGFVLGINSLSEYNLEEIKKIKDEILAARPTGYDLEYCLNYVFLRVIKTDSLQEARKIALVSANELSEINKQACFKIGDYGASLIKDGFRILTHCNAGALATVDYGTALAPIRFAHKEGRDIFVYVDETRPRLQGAKLTAWELAEEGIAHAVIADNAAGYYMQQGEVDMVITGADRITLNGDAANKIGTYEKAVVAYENKIPFYIAAPFSTIDFNMKSGSEIPIEERAEEEVAFIDGIRILPKKSQVLNPAFDITPAKYITAIITEKGLLNPNSLNSLV
jgi:S-methyl-5-thioribose-1-phosphate isomerase